MCSWRIYLGALFVALTVALGAQAHASEPAWLEAPLWFHVAETEAGAVGDEAFLARQLQTANRIFAPHRIRFRRVGRSKLAARHAELISRKHRDALARYVRDGVVDVFVVGRLMDVDEPGRQRRGVHWRPRHAPERRLVIVSAISMDDVLAHELGHFLGNRAHSPEPGNLMSYLRADGLPWLGQAQVTRARRTLADMLAAGQLSAHGNDARRAQ